MVPNGYNTGNESGKIGWKNLFTKPIELYVFIDPLCPECWALEPILKKLQIEYGDKFRIRHILTGQLSSLNRRQKMSTEVAKKWERTSNRSGMSCDGDVWHDEPIYRPFAASIAIKAAELQGQKAGIKYLRKLQEFLFLEKLNITKYDILIEIAQQIEIDLDEFMLDLHSKAAIKAFQCDLKITHEMEVEESPTLVFFNNDDIEEEGIKLSGSYPYEVYVEVLSQILQRKLRAHTPPPLEEFLAYFKFVATKEISVVYDLSCEEVEREMKKLMLKQKVEKVPVKYGTFWRYIEQA